ncbi:ribosome maturation factor RimP [soil metagenome]
MRKDTLTHELEARVEELGFELVDVERVGDARRPILRLRVDRLESAPGAGVSLDDCSRISRALETHLDAREDLAGNYVLEVSSPGVERPLVRRRDWHRFAGREIALRGKGVLAGRAARLEGTLLGLVDGNDEAQDRIAVRLPDGEEVQIPLAEVKGANLVHRWGETGQDEPRST